MCDICKSEKETRHINLYVNGSEGLNVCHACEMIVVNLIRALQQVGNRTAIATHKRIRKNFFLRGKGYET